MSLSVAVMAHPKRVAFVDELLPDLPGATIVWDRFGDRWDTGRRALLAFDASAEFHVVVQDDALLCKDFIAGAELVAQAAGGNRPIGLYVGKVRPHAHTVTPAVLRALRDGVPWICGIGPLWGVAVVLPTAHIGELVDWCDGRRHIANYDRRIEAWYREQRVDCWYPIPSLVDHRSIDENPSLVPGRGDDRRAHVFLGDRSPLEIDWTRLPLPIHGLTVEAVIHNPAARDERSASMGVRRFVITHENGNEVVKLIDEKHVDVFARTPGVVSIEPADDEVAEPTAVTYDERDESSGGEDPGDENAGLVQELRDQIADLEDELSETRKRLTESERARAELEAELVSLRDQLPTEGASEPGAGEDVPDVASQPLPDDEAVSDPGPYDDLNQPALKAKLDEREVAYPPGPVSNDDLRALLVADDETRDDDSDEPGGDDDSDESERDDDGEAIA